MQCTAHSKRSGKPCKKHAVNGTTVCLAHGAGAPQVKAKARQRLLETVDPLVSRLIEIGLDDTQPVTFACTECGEENRVKAGIDPRAALVAIRDALDRAGLGAVRQVEIVTLDAIDAEIARLEAELGLNDELVDDS